MKISISQLSQWTGKTRETVSKRLAGLPFVDAGAEGKLYESALALCRIYQVNVVAEQGRIYLGHRCSNIRAVLKGLPPKQMAKIDQELTDIMGLPECMNQKRTSNQ